jgi:hypothetical protein
MTDRLGRLLAELPVPAADEARERTVTAACAAVEALPARRRRPRRAAVAAGVLALGLALVSPPGQAAISRLGELVGIGEVGEPPTLGPAHGVIVDNGRAPDGSGYEWTAYRAGNTYEIDGERVRLEESCIGLDWPQDRRQLGWSSCSAFPDTSKTPYGRYYLTSHEIRRLDSGDVLLTGTTTAEPRALRIVYTDAQGREHELAVDFARVEGEVLERIGARQPFGVFTAFVPAAQAERDRLSRHRDLGVIFPVMPGPREEPDPNLPPECRYDPPPGPFEYRFYGPEGELIDRVPTRVGRFAPAGCEP